MKPVRRIAQIVATDPVRLMPILDEMMPKGKVLGNQPKPVIMKILARLEQAAFWVNGAHCQTIMLQYRGSKPIDVAGFDPADWLIGDLGEGRPPVPGKPFEEVCPDCGQAIRHPSQLRAV
jgi:hypothetical protein